MSNVEQALSTAVGATIGFFVGGPAGALKGAQFGFLAGSALFPGELPPVEGPRLEDLERLNADPGTPIPIVYGTERVTGFPMYLGPGTEIRATEEVGGKGGPTQEVTEFHYLQTIALGLCKGPIDGILRVWENGELVYDIRPQQEDESAEEYAARAEMSEAYAQTFTLYLGTEEQEPDPTLEEEQGAGHVQAFRDLAYMVFPNRELKREQGQVHPMFGVEVVKKGDIRPSRYVATASEGSNGFRVAVSDDAGETWQLKATPADEAWESVAYSPPLERLVAVAGAVADSGRRRWMVSDDGGETWTEHSIEGFTASGNSRSLVTWVSDYGMFVWAIQSSSTAVHIFTSPDGLAWTEQHVTSTSRYTRNFAYDPVLGRLVFTLTAPLGADQPDTFALYTDDGLNYVEVLIATGSRNAGVHVAHTGQQFVAVRGGRDFNLITPPDVFPAVWMSTTAATWPTGQLLRPDFPIIWDASAEPWGGSTAGGAAITVWGITGLVWADFGQSIRRLIAVGARSSMTGDYQQSLTQPVVFVSPSGGQSTWTGVPLVSAPDPGAWQHIVFDSATRRAIAIGNSSTALLIEREGEDLVYRTTSLPASARWTGLAVIPAVGHAEGVSIASIIEDICSRCGLGDDRVNASELAEEFVHGYAISRLTDGRGAIEALRLPGLFDIVESDRQLKFPVRGKASVATIGAADLGVYAAESEPPPAVTTRKIQDVELPRQIRLRYRAVSRDYAVGEQLSPARIGTASVNDVTIDCTVALTDERAAQLVEIAFREAWASRYSHSFQIGPEYHALEPADVVMLPVDDRLYRVRIASIADEGLMVRRCEGVRDDDGSYASIRIATAPPRVPPTIELIGETDALLLDLPALREQDDDGGFYIAAWRTGPGQTWPGARIFRSVDEGATYQPLATVGSQAIVGEVVSAPAGGHGYTWIDDAEIVVELEQGALESRTDAAVIAGANLAAIGAPGRWQLVQFANAELVSPGRYKLTRLLLGRRGTEHLIGTTEVGDRFVLVSGPGILRLPLQASEIGAARLYRVVTAGLAFDSAEDVPFTGQAQALKCFSPAHVSGTRNESGDLTISAIRRDRLSPTLRDGVEVPMSEDSEAYEVDILDGPGGSVVRTMTGLSTPSAAYSAADQTTDFGSPQAVVTVRFYQLSAQVGRGTPVEATI